MTIDEMKAAFTYQKPNEKQAVAYEDLRGEAYALADSMVRMCHDSRELSTALTKLREAVMWANAAIALHGLK